MGKTGTSIHNAAQVDLRHALVSHAERKISKIYVYNQYTNAVLSQRSLFCTLSLFFFQVPSPVPCKSLVQYIPVSGTSTFRLYALAK